MSKQITNYDCQECYRNVEPTEYHPYFYCELHKAGLLDKYLAEIARLKQQWQLEAGLELANELKKSMISTSPFITEILQPLIDTTEAQLKQSQNKEE